MFWLWWCLTSPSPGWNDTTYQSAISLGLTFFHQMISFYKPLQRARSFLARFSALDRLWTLVRFSLRDCWRFLFLRTEIKMGTICGGKCHKCAQTCWVEWTGNEIKEPIRSSLTNTLKKKNKKDISMKGEQTERCMDAGDSIIISRTRLWLLVKQCRQNCKLFLTKLCTC